ncbi:hypothetical protein JCM10295v2_002365 [Rhodotorula toruloides]
MELFGGVQAAQLVSLARAAFPLLLIVPRLAFQICNAHVTGAALRQSYEDGLYPVVGGNLRTELHPGVHQRQGQRMRDEANVLNGTTGAFREGSSAPAAGQRRVPSAPRLTGSSPQGFTSAQTARYGLLHCSPAQRSTANGQLPMLRSTVPAQWLQRLASVVPLLPASPRTIVPSRPLLALPRQRTDLHSSTTMPSASDVQAALTHLLSSLPPGANPFDVLHEWLQSTLKHELPQSFYIQLYIILGIFALFWLPGSGAWLATHALASGYIQHIYINSSDSSGANKAQRRLTWGVLLEWLAFLVSMAPFCAIAHQHWTKSLDMFRQIDAKLLQQASTFTGSFSTNDIAWLSPALLARGARQLKVMKSVRSVFGKLDPVSRGGMSAELAFNAGWLVVLVSFVDIAGGLHIRSLGQILGRLGALRLDGQVERSERRQMRFFRQTYSGLVGTVVVFTVVCLSMMGLALYIHAVFGGIIGIILLRLTLTTTIFAQPGDHSLSFSDPTSQSRGGTFSSSKYTSRAAKRARQTIGIDVSTVVQIRHEDGAEVGGEHFELQPAGPSFTPSSSCDEVKLGEKQLGRLDETVEKGAAELYFLDFEGKRDNVRR